MQPRRGACAGVGLRIARDGRPLGKADLLRASTKVPGSAYKGAGTRALSSVLNGHLLRSEQYVAACEDWTPQEVQEFMGKIDAHRNAGYKISTKAPATVAAKPSPAATLHIGSG